MNKIAPVNFKDEITFMADDNSNEGFQAKDGAPSSNPLLIILLVVNILFMGIIAFLIYKSHSERASEPSVKDVIAAELKAQKEAEEEIAESGMAKEDEGILFHLVSYTANLVKGKGPRRFIWLKHVLKFSKKSNEEEFKGRKPQINDAIISLLNSKRPDDLLKVEGKNYLKEEIKASINTFLVDGEVIDVYYVGFQIN